ncbi:MAG: DUF692 domain-containing protein [Legionellales bacterium]|jgi:hypothetical protein
MSNHKEFLGFGLGLRPDHYNAILAEQPAVDWFEILTENYLIPGGKPLDFLDKIRTNYPMVMHGVSMSLGSTDPIDLDYLRELKALIKRVEPKWISDHLCWTGIHNKNMHDLLPLPYTQEAIDHIVNKISQVQEFLGQRILIENLSSYITYQQSLLPEWEFLAQIAKQADCLILLDVNNVYVSANNHEFSPMDYINAMPVDRVMQIHLAGHSYEDGCIIDTHDHPIIDPVWDLYEKTLKRLGPVSTMIERDDHIPPLSELLTELNHAREIAKKVLNHHEYA